MPLGEPSRSLCRVVAWAGFVVSVAACSSAGADLPTPGAGRAVDPATTGQTVALAELQRDQQRLDDVAFPLLRAARSICAEEDVLPRIGLRYASLASYPPEWQPAARETLDPGDLPTVTSIPDGFPAASSGLRPGDRILEADDTALEAGESGLRGLEAALSDLRGGEDGIDLVVERDGDEIQLELGPALDACGYGVALSGDIGMDAYADGANIVVGADMVRSATDEELAVIVSHALAHNALGHVRAVRGRVVSGQRPDLASEVAFASWERAAPEGGAFSDAVELDADHVALYALANTGRDVDGAVRFWREMAGAGGEHAAFTAAHPVTEERVAQLERTAEEIEKRRAARLSLVPELLTDPEAGDGEGVSEPAPPAVPDPDAVRPGAVSENPETAVLIRELDEMVHGWLRTLDAGDFGSAAAMTGGVGDASGLRYWWGAIQGESGRLVSTQTLQIRRTHRGFVLDVVAAFDSGRQAELEIRLDPARTLVRWRSGRGGAPDTGC